MKKYNMSYSFAKDILNHGVQYATWKKENYEPKFNFGSCYHMFVLESEKFEQTYKVCDLNKNTKAFKEWLETANIEKHNVITNDILSQLRDMKKSLLENPDIADNLEIAEREKIIEKEIDGQNFKMIADILTSDLVIDLKTTSSLDPDFLSRQVKTMMYDMQAWLYLAMTCRKRMLFVFQEDKFPYYSRTIELDDGWFARGEHSFLSAYQKYQDYLNIGESLVKTPVVLEIPGYVTYMDETEYEKINF